jgi:hypothetical protein
MKPTVALCLVVILKVAAAGQTACSDALAALHKLNASVDWNVSSAEIADVDCDGKPDTVMLGSEKDKVAVGVVFAVPGKQPQIFMFPTRADRQDGFCSKPQRINVSPLDCQSDDGILAGCKAITGCKAFQFPTTTATPSFSIGT